MAFSLLRVFKHRKARKSVGHALKASAVPPNSGFVSVDNSQGASTTVAGLSHHLDACMDDLDLDGTYIPLFP